MSKKLRDQNAPDDLRIELKHEYQIRYWTQKFKVSREDLKRAIDTVGPIAAAVEQQLRGGPR